ncbi:MAG: sigma factor [Caldilineaceae bacterium]
MVDRHGTYVYNLALRVIRQPDEAQEVAQEAFVRLAWVARLSTRSPVPHLALSHCGQSLLQSAAPVTTRPAILAPDSAAHHLADPQQQVEAGLLSAELQAMLHQAIDALPPPIACSLPCAICKNSVTMRWSK